VILLDGSATDKLANAIYAAGGKEIVAGRFDNLEKAFDQARALAREGEIVLLSPGCASFGMFANEFERGDRFKQIVNRL
jgi:UDP-N-acetylmuramoylalanine--D-glutamate ligase